MKSNETLTAARQRFLHELEKEANVARHGGANEQNAPPPTVGGSPSFIASILWGLSNARRRYPEWRRSLQSLPWWPAGDSPWREVASYSLAALIASAVLALVLWWYLPPEWLTVSALVLTMFSWVRLTWMYRRRPSAMRPA
jgi:hypothetical protein